MIVTISQPRYLPWLGYFHRVAVSDLFIYLDTVQYTPRDWENSYKVKTDRGWTWSTVPVKASYRALIPEVKVDNEQAWQDKHWKTIQTYYGGAPYFHEYSRELSALYNGKSWFRLTDLNQQYAKLMCNFLGLKATQFMRASEMTASGKGSQLILDLCKEVGATVYLSGAEGQNYLDELAFRDAGIQIIYQRYNHPIYPQRYGQFEPYMGVIDLLFNCGDRSSKTIMDGQSRIRS